jgi:hypothetical protein
MMSHNGPSWTRRSLTWRMAEEAARRAREKADRLDLIEWNERMRLGGPAQPSPTLGAAMRYGYRFLRVRCSTCRQTAFVALGDLDRAPETAVWQLEGVLACQQCRSQGARAPRGIIERLTIEKNFDE